MLKKPFSPLLTSPSQAEHVPGSYSKLIISIFFLLCHHRVHSVKTRKKMVFIRLDLGSSTFVLLRWSRPRKTKRGAHTVPFAEFKCFFVDIMHCQLNPRLHSIPKRARHNVKFFQTSASSGVVCGNVLNPHPLARMVIWYKGAFPQRQTQLIFGFYLSALAQLRLKDLLWTTLIF